MVGAPKFVPRTQQSASGPAAGCGGLDRRARRAWAGRGSGAVCDVCHQTIDEDQIEYEVELCGGSKEFLTLHLDCYEQWMLTHEPLRSL